MPLDPRRFYPVCTGGKRAGPPEDGGGAWAYLQRVDQHHIPLEAMATLATALERLLKADDQTTIRRIADRVGISAPALYLYFKDKEARRLSPIPAGTLRSS